MSPMLLGLLVVTACDPYEPTLHPDYAIQVMPNAAGGTALAPACPNWVTETTDPYDNQPLPQYGCATARNLAAQVERPDDLLQGRNLGEMRGVTAVGSIRRYDNNQPRGLIWTGSDANQAAATTSASGASTLTGDITGGAGAASSSSGASTSSSGAAAGP